MSGVACDPQLLLERGASFDPRKVAVLEKVVGALLTSSDARHRDVAHRILDEFKNDPDSWRHVAMILSESSDANTKFFALQILESCITSRWNVLPPAERSGIKQYVTELTLQLAGNEQVCQQERHFLNKVNENLIQIVKREWPERWPTFIKELCESSRSGQLLCENNMRLLNLLSEEVFDFGEDQLGSKRTEQLMDQMTHDFKEIFDLCFFILQSYIAAPGAVKDGLVTQTLQCLAHFLKWIPFGYIFQTELIEVLVNSFWDSFRFRVECVKCLYEISNLRLKTEEAELFKPKLERVWRLLVEKCWQLPPNSFRYDDVSKVANQMRMFWEVFYCQFSLCLTAFLRHHRDTICQADWPSLQVVLVTLVKTTCVPHDETFRICLDCWQKLAEALYEQTIGQRPLNNDNILQQYQPVLDDVRRALIGRMAKPAEVYIQFDEESGTAVRDYHTNTDEIALYDDMRDTLVYMTHLGQDRTENVMLGILKQECTIKGSDEQPWNPTTLNRLCWALGSISGALSEDAERRLVVAVLRELLHFCEAKRGKENKTIIASCIMTIIGQYPRFLRAHWTFLQTVVLKLFEFMQETFPGVQDMACEAFYKVARQCSRTMALQRETPTPFVVHLLHELSIVTNVLTERQSLHVYEGLAHVIAAGTDDRLRNEHLDNLMGSCMAAWRSVLQEAHTAPNVLDNHEKTKTLVRVLRVHQRVAKACGPLFQGQVKAMLPDMLRLYLHFASVLSTASQTVGGQNRLKQVAAKTQRLVLKEAVGLLEAYASALPDGGDLHGSGNGGGPWLVEGVHTILKSYAEQPAEVREPALLAFGERIIVKSRTTAAGWLPGLFDMLFAPTLSMLMSDFHSFPDHREGFYAFLASCTEHCFADILKLPSHHLKAFVDSLIWAIQHQHPAIAEQGLAILLLFLSRLTSPEAAGVLHEFCKACYFPLLEAIFMVMTDTLHRSGFRLQTAILSLLIATVNNGTCCVPEAQLTRDAVMANLIRMLSAAFQNLHTKQTEAFVVDIFNFSAVKVTDQFRTHIKDFLVSLKNFSGDDDEFYEAERREALQRARDLEAQRRAQVPGLSTRIEKPPTLRDVIESDN